MASSTARMRYLLRVVLLGIMMMPTVLATYTPFVPLSFFFNYDIQGQSPRIPITEQCQTININWSRAQATGPSPVAPYFLQVYTSAYLWPFKISAGSGLSFQWQVPFAPGTLYQICMFDSIGSTGGCQDIYTMVASTTSTSPTCSNVTIPAKPLDVSGQVVDGPLSRYGWIPSCTDIAVTPKNGTPPYIFTISPPLHPPYNITSNASTINWTVSFTWAMPFFISVLDSAGNSWANGPLHSASGSSTECLGISSATPPKKPFPTVTLASAIGSAVGGLLLGAILMHFLRRSRTSTDPDYKYSPRNYPIAIQPMSPTSQYRAVPDIDMGAMSPTDPGGTQYHIEPFTMPGEEDRSSGNEQRVTSPSDVPLSPGGRGDTDSPMPQVYVVHHDGGQMPVTVYTAGGAVVTELPPGYPGGSDGPAPGPSTQRPGSISDFATERRQPGPTPRKSAGSSVVYNE